MRRPLPLVLIALGLLGTGCATSKETPQANPPVTKTAEASGDAPASKEPSAPADLTPESIAKAADVPLYPGAQAPDGMSMMPKKRDDGSTHYSLVLATNDPVKKVAAWYTEKLNLRAMSGMIIGKSPKGNDLILKIAPEAGRTLVHIKSIAYSK